MTALPEPPGHLLTVAEYAALGEIESGYLELLEGRVLMSPSPGPDHNWVSLELAVQLRPQLPDHLEVIQTSTSTCSRPTGTSPGSAADRTW